MFVCGADVGGAGRTGRVKGSVSCGGFRTGGAGAGGAGGRGGAGGVGGVGGGEGTGRADGVGGGEDGVAAGGVYSGSGDSPDLISGFAQRAAPDLSSADIFSFDLSSIALFAMETK